MAMRAGNLLHPGALAVWSPDRDKSGARAKAVLAPRAISIANVDGFMRRLGILGSALLAVAAFGTPVDAQVADSVVRPE